MRAGWRRRGGGWAGLGEGHGGGTALVVYSPVLKSGKMEVLTTMLKSGIQGQHVSRGTYICTALHNILYLQIANMVDILVDTIVLMYQA